MGLPQLKIHRGPYMQIYTPPSCLVQAAPYNAAGGYGTSNRGSAQTARLNAKWIRKPGDKRKIREFPVLAANQDLASQDKER